MVTALEFFHQTVHRFACDSLHPISQYDFTYGSRNTESQSGGFVFNSEVDQFNSGPAHPAALPEQPIKPAFPFQDRRTNSTDSQMELLPVLLIGNGEAVTALLSSTGEHFTTVSGSHSGTEAVGPCSFQFTGLERTFHEFRSCRKVIISILKIGF